MHRPDVILWEGYWSVYVWGTNLCAQVSRGEQFTLSLGTQSRELSLTSGTQDEKKKNLKRKTQTQSDENAKRETQTQSDENAKRETQTQSGENAKRETQTQSDEDAKRKAHNANANLKWWRRKA